MDRSYGENTYAYNLTEPIPGRPSIESVTSGRLQKKRSVRRVRSDANALSRSGTSESPLFRQAPEKHQRKSSLRDAVKKIFSRRSKVADPQPSSIQSTPLRHKSHNSQPPLEIVVPKRVSPDVVSDRAHSAPLRQNTPSVDLPRLRSPNAVEFPKSRHLKPLALPTPFDDPRGTLRRRKTLPSILVPPEDAREIAALISSAEQVEAEDEMPLPNTGLVVQTSKKAKRRSRSAGDLREQALQAGPQRKRSDEIRFWRESIQTAIRRNSEYAAEENAIIEPDGIKTPPRNSRNEPQLASIRASPPYDVRSSMYGTELSRDLEDRVAKLEANLHFFQRSLHRLQSGKGRNRYAESGARHGRRDSADFRTPSMLAEDLRTPLAPSQYQYGFEPDRPATAPSRPTRPPRPEEIPPVPVIIRQPVEEAKPHRATTPPKRPSRPDDPPSPREDTSYQSLYVMLNDERLARRRLETQLQDMRTEISDLQHQVLAHSQMHSQRSSYLYAPASDVTAGSSRLRELLAGAEELSRRSLSPAAVRMPVKVVSRFSASTRQESEAEATQASSEEIQEVGGAERTLKLKRLDDETSQQQSEQVGYDDFKTPTQTGGFPLPPSYKHRGEGEMF